MNTRVWWMAVALCGGCASLESEQAAPAVAAAPRQPLLIKGALHRQKNSTEEVNDKYLFTWDRDQRVTLAAETSGYTGLLRVFEPSGRELHDNTSTRIAEFAFDARAGVTYTVMFQLYLGGPGVYLLEADPAPARNERPVVPASARKPAPEEAVSDAQVHAAIGRFIDGAKPLGPTQRGRLDSLRTLRAAVSRGQCVRAVMVLDRDARLNRDGLDNDGNDLSIILAMHTAVDDVISPLGDELGNARVLGTEEEICPKRGGYAEVTFSVDSFAWRNGGTGGFALRFFQHRISEAELRELYEDADESRCAACIRKHAACVHSWDPTHCMRDFRSCERAHDLHCS